MVRLTSSIVATLVVAAFCSAQEENTKTGFDFLKRFEGNWNMVSIAPGQSTPTAKGTFEARVLGNHWLVCEQKAQMGARTFNAIQRIGYDSANKRYIGTWFDNMAKHVWDYDGELDASGNKLTLNASGPDWSDPGKTRDYRDIYEFRSDLEIAVTSQIKNNAGDWNTFMTATLTKTTPVSQSETTTVTPFLMFAGNGADAIEHYKTVFSDLKILNIKKRGDAATGKDGTIEVADISIAGQRVRVIDSQSAHFEFTPAFSFFVECEDEEQLNNRFEKLSEGGKVMMPLNNYGFSRKFGRTSDKFGVSWQLNLK